MPRPPSPKVYFPAVVRAVVCERSDPLFRRPLDAVGHRDEAEGASFLFGLQRAFDHGDTGQRRQQRPAAAGSSRPVPTAYQGRLTEVAFPGAALREAFAAPPPLRFV